MTTNPLLTLVAPAFNEADVLDSVLDELFAAIDGLPDGSDAQVVVVDDGSSDATWDVLRRYASSEPRLRVLHHHENRGFGAAVRTGFEATNTRYAMMIPGDGQWDPSELAAFHSAAREGVFIAVGVRDRRAQSFYSRKRRVLSAAYTFLMRLLFDINCRDLAWVHLYDLESVDWRTPRSPSPFYPAEIALWNLGRKQVPEGAFRQIPSTMRMRSVGRSRIATPVVMLIMLRDILACAWRVRRKVSSRAQEM